MLLSLEEYSTIKVVKCFLAEELSSGSGKMGVVAKRSQDFLERDR